MNGLRSMFVEVVALLRGSGAALSVAQCLDDMARVQRDLERAIAARDRAISVAGMAASGDSVGHVGHVTEQHARLLHRKDDGGAEVVPIRKPKSAQ